MCHQNEFFVYFYGANYSISRRLSVRRIYSCVFSPLAVANGGGGVVKKGFHANRYRLYSEASIFVSGLVFNILINYFTAWRSVTFFSLFISLLPLLVLIMAVGSWAASAIVVAAAVEMSCHLHGRIKCTIIWTGPLM